MTQPEIQRVSPRNTPQAQQRRVTARIALMAIQRVLMSEEFKHAIDMRADDRIKTAIKDGVLQPGPNYTEPT